MNESAFKTLLTSSPEHPPVLFHQRMESTLAEIVRQEENEMKESTKQALKKGSIWGSRTLAIALVITLLLGSVALAAGLGLFQQLSQMPQEDKRLPALDQVSTPLNQSAATDAGVTVTIRQAYYDGERIFVSYKLEGERVSVEKGEGIPQVEEWAFQQEGMLYSRDYDSAMEGDEEIAAWLDGTSPRWARRTATAPHDGLSLSDGTYLDIISGNAYQQEDGSEIGWKECLVPQDKQADTLEVNLMLFTGTTTYYQDEKGMKWAYERIGENTLIPFTVTKDGATHALRGRAGTKEWQAEANITLSPVDIRGEIIVTCPESWISAIESWDSGGANPIVDWQLYDGDTRVEGHNLSSGYGKLSATQLTFSICFQHGTDTKHLKLVPVFLDGSCAPHQAIALEIPQNTPQ